MRLSHFLTVPTALALLVALPSCRRAPDAEKGPYAAMVAEAIPGIERSVGLKFKTQPKLETRSKEQVRQFVLQEIDSPKAQAELAGTEVAYKLLGMIPDTLQLKPLFVNLLSEQIVGYYDPKTKVLYVVGGSAKDVAQVTVTHELVHALQDQYVNLDSVQNMGGDNDRQVAAQAIFEGQAVYVQLQVMLGNGNVAVNMPGGWERVRQAIRDNQASMPIYASAPLVLQETLIFPYLSGTEFIKNYTEHEHGVPYNNMPVSTEQVMHPGAFFGKHDDPTIVSFTAGTGGPHVYDNDLGEFETRLFLFQHLQSQDDAVRGATGWDGDRYLVYKTRQGNAITWATVWDTKADAADFYALLQRAIDARQSANPGKRVMKATTGEIAGRPVVLMEDVPVGADPTAVTLKNIQLK
jgi:hypothetical protein